MSAKPVPAKLSADAESLATRRQFAAALGTAASVGAQSPRRPNIVFVCSDQHSFRYAGFAGHPLVKTPNLDRIASQGVVLDNAYRGSQERVPAARNASRPRLRTAVEPPGRLRRIALSA